MQLMGIKKIKYHIEVLTLFCIGLETSIRISNTLHYTIHLNIIFDHDAFFHVIIYSAIVRANLTDRSLCRATRVLLRVRYVLHIVDAETMYYIYYCTAQCTVNRKRDESGYMYVQVVALCVERVAQPAGFCLVSSRARVDSIEIYGFQKMVFSSKRLVNRRRRHN